MVTQWPGVVEFDLLSRIEPSFDSTPGRLDQITGLPLFNPAPLFARVDDDGLCRHEVSVGRRAADNCTDGGMVSYLSNHDFQGFSEKNYVIPCRHCLGTVRTVQSARRLKGCSYATYSHKTLQSVGGVQLLYGLENTRREPLFLPLDQCARRADNGPKFMDLGQFPTPRFLAAPKPPFKLAMRMP